MLRYWQQLYEVREFCVVPVWYGILSVAPMLNLLPLGEQPYPIFA